MEKERLTYPLLPYSNRVWKELQSNPDTEWYEVLARWDKKVMDSERLKEACICAIRNHPVFLTEIDDNGQQYAVKRDDVLHGSYHNVDFGRDEEGEYARIRINRILGDGISHRILVEDICRAYNGEELERDDYWGYLNRVQDYQQAYIYHRHEQSLRNYYGSVNYPVAPKENIGNGNEGGLIKFDLSIEEKEIETFKHTWLLPLDGMFILATAMAIMQMEGATEAGLTWAYGGREKEEEQRVYGSLHRDIPICIKYGEIPKMIRQTRAKMRRGIAASDYPFTLIADDDSPWHRAVNVIIEPDWTEVWNMLPVGITFQEVQTLSKMAYLDVEVTPYPLGMQLRYDTFAFSEQAITTFGTKIKENLAQILSTRR